MPQALPSRAQPSRLAGSPTRTGQPRRVGRRRRARRQTSPRSRRAPRSSGWPKRSRMPSSTATCCSPKPAPAPARPSPTWCPALLSGLKTIISTGTRALQDQLYHRDLPRVRDALGVGMKTALLKGRANYLCQYRLEQAKGEPNFGSREQVAQFQRIVAWGGRTRMGDLAELEALPDDSPLLPLVTSTAENCLGSECPFWSRMLRGAGAPARAGGRPGGRQPPPAARRPGAQAGRLRRDPAGRAGVRGRRGAPVAGPGRAVLRRRPRRAPAGGTGARCDRRMQGRAGCAGDAAGSRRASSSMRCARCARRWKSLPARGTRHARCTTRQCAMRSTRWPAALRSSPTALVPLREASPGFDACHARAQDFAARAARAGSVRARPRMRDFDARRDDDVRWYELSPRGFRLQRTPLDVSGPLRAAPRTLAGGVGVHLGDAGGRRRFRPFRRRASAWTRRPTLLEPSPFDWNTQALCYLPPRLPEPMSRDYNARTGRRVAAGAGSLRRPRLRAVRLASRAARSRRSRCATGRGRCSCRARRRARAAASASANPATACCWARRVSAKASTSPATR